MVWCGMVWYDILEIVECEKSDVLKKKAAPKLFLDLGIGVDAEMGWSKSLTFEDIYQRIYFYWTPDFENIIQPFFAPLVAQVDLFFLWNSVLYLVSKFPPRHKPLFLR